MNSLAGTLTLVRLAVRRDRFILPACIAAFTFMVTVSTSATVALYPTVESRIQAAAGINNIASLVALYGRIYDETSLGAVSMIKMGGLGASMVALLGLFTVIRHTRAEEESGRLELVGGAAVGRFAPLSAALLIGVGSSLVLGAVTAIALSAIELPVAGSIAFGLSWAGVGVAFAAIAAVAAQLARSARAASGIAAATLATVYVLRAVGDTSTGPARWLTWASPIGWGQQVRPFAGDRWWPLLLLFGFAALAAVAAFALAARRDLGAGILPDRPGPASAPHLRTPFALAWRLQRPVLLGWAIGFLLLGAVFGGIAANIGDIFNSPEARAMIEALGGEGGLTDAFIAAELGLIGMFVGAYGIQACLRLRQEEVAQHAEALLATSVNRLRWAGSHIVLALAGVALLLTLAGLSAGTALATQSGDASDIGRVLGGALVQLPAAAVLVGIAVALFGFAPRLSSLGWAALISFLLLGELGPVLELPSIVVDLSPFAHVPKAPAAEITFPPLLCLGLVAAALTVAGLAAFRRRDIT